MRHSRQYYLRRLHRYLGVTIGVQFLLWTAGGLYFSWSDMDEIHGDHQRLPAPLLAPDTAVWVSPSRVIAHLRATGERPDSILSLRLVPVLDAVCWQITYIDQDARQRRPRKTRLADAKTGVLRPALSKEEAIEVASRQFIGRPAIASARYLEAVPPDHEYRENPLPAWAVTFGHPSKTTVYVAAELGTVEKFRNEKWRIFDWFWMLHVMDYESRDHIGNWLLRILSILGLLTICSGFTLFIASSPLFQRWIGKF
ncbi:MAG: PepSY domain-containing protein [Thermoanaerobaculia bacterium]|nr:PepSY domain-containing protein [Thermoanaerobaculia bacterium]